MMLSCRGRGGPRHAFPTYLLIQLGPLAGDCGDIRGDTGLDKQLVDFLELLAVLRHVVEQRGKVEAKGAIELALNHARRHNAPAQVHRLIGQDQLIEKGRLAVDNLASLGAHPEVAINELVAAKQPAVGKLCEAVPRLIGG